MKLLLIVIFISCSHWLLGQENPTTPTRKSPNNSNYDSFVNQPPSNILAPSTHHLHEDIYASTKAYSRLMTSYEFGLSIGVLLFGLIVILLEIYLLKTKILNDSLLIKCILITLIVTATLFLITAGYSNDQIAPAIGLFGAVSGYLMGKSSRESKVHRS